jgi:hypothetical protein
MTTFLGQLSVDLEPVLREFGHVNHTSEKSFGPICLGIWSKNYSANHQKVILLGLFFLVEMDN